ncbi:MAG: hypothetical protein NTY35_15320 [Planctomycetota bacterium]|nr:hypothetical protein [Planctomycetota bacterium]
MSFEAVPYRPLAVPHSIDASIRWDDGSGPATYLGIYATDINSSAIQRWDGHSLTTVGVGVRGSALDFAVFDSGSGDQLYVGGELYIQGQKTLVARWTGSQWEPIATTWFNGYLVSLRVHDDGHGPALFAGGSFAEIGGVSTWGVARWNGTAWSSLGTGAGSELVALEVHDEGSGPALFLAGDFRNSAGNPLANVVRWDGSALTAVGGGLPTVPLVQSLRSFSSGQQSTLVAVGAVPSGNPNRVVAWSWDSQAWTEMPSPGGSFTLPRTLAVSDVGFGRQLVVGVYSQPSGFVRRFTGNDWVQVGDALMGTCGYSAQSPPWFLGDIDFGDGPRLSVSGGMTGTGGGVHGLAFTLAGNAWVPPGRPERGIDPQNTVTALVSFDDGTGPGLVAAGLCWIDGRLVTGVARRQGGSWQDFSMPGVAPTVYGLAVCDLGTGPQLHAGVALHGYAGSSGVLRWSGSAWSGLGEGLSEGGGYARALVAGDLGSGRRLYAGGSFLRAGGIPSPNLAAWNGVAWSAMPPGPTAGVNGTVHALVIYDDGSGAALYLGGAFTAQTAGATLSRIARWNGTSYSALGSGMNGDVWALRAFDDGSGTKLYAAGAFTTAGGVPVQRVARFDGATWSPVGAGFDALVTCLEVFDDGSGPALYAAGDFMASGATPVTHIARWDGSAWSALGNGVGPAVYALASHAESPGEPAQLFVGGSLQTAGTLATSNLAAWRGCGGAIDRFCFGDGTSSPCPCDNSGLAARGCDNSAGTRGARLNATGTTAPDTIELYVAGETPNGATLVFQGDVLLSSPVPFGDGLRCVGGSLQRLYTTNAVNGSLAVPSAGQASISARSAQLGDPLAPGAVRGYQAWYRDVDSAFCSPPSGAGWNLSNAVRVAW